MAITAKCEAGTLADGDVRLSNLVTLTGLTGLAHAGGASLEDADKLLVGYWVVCVRDRDADGVLTKADAPWDVQVLWLGVADGYHAVGWDGPAGELLQGGKTLTFVRGVAYLMVVVAVAVDGTRSASVTWPNGATDVDVEQLLGLTADGLTGRNVSDYEALRFRHNRIDPPQRLLVRGADEQ